MDRTKSRKTLTAGILVGFVAGMVGLSFASVPLYRLFCQVTGYGGTPNTEAVVVTDEISDHTVTVRFDSNVNSALPWRFKPEQRLVDVRLGEERLAFYQAKNISDERITGTATFSVTPYKAAPYFSKIDCFCFTEQTLEAGQSVSMPVSFFVDPEFAEDPNTRDVTTITLSYTFYPIDDEDTDSAAEEKLSGADPTPTNDRALAARSSMN
jgi:cytochrome c oxidase assembly protein subunit 11